MPPVKFQDCFRWNRQVKGAPVADYVLMPMMPLLESRFDQKFAGNERDEEMRRKDFSQSNSCHVLKLYFALAAVAGGYTVHFKS